ncbi:MAG: ABC transporter ATP-binding protein [Clostridium sp.]
MQTYLTADGLTVGYRKKPVLSNISMKISRGSIVTLIGPNGAGKSTILKSVIRELSPMGGSVFLDGTSIENYSDSDFAKKTAVVMTGRPDPELMTCFDVAAAGRYPYTGRFGILSKEDKKKVLEALELVQCGSLAEVQFRNTSDGQKQRILLARAICQEPELLVLDEPTSFLDVRHKLELLEILKKLVQERNVAVLMSLHELDLAERISDYVLCAESGTIGRAGTPSEVFERDYIAKLYGIERGSYLTSLGFPELPKVDGTPKVFVIGGMGSGIPVYHALNRAGIPFAAGVIHENDMEYQTVEALAAEVIPEIPFEPVGERAFLRAKELLESCEAVLCPLKLFGTMNERNRELLRIGTGLGKLRQINLDKSDSGDILNYK